MTFVTKRLEKFFQKKTILITGASSGIGKALALELSRLGADIYLVARNEKKLDETIGLLEKEKKYQHQRFVSIACDITQKQQIKERICSAIENQTIDVLINNAGVSVSKRLVDTSDDEVENIIQVNTLGTILLTKALLTNVLKSSRKQIVFISSVLGYFGIYGYSAYAASKHALSGFSEALCMEYNKKELNVSLVFPSDTITPQFYLENQTKPIETKNLAFTPPLKANYVACKILEGVALGKSKIFPCRKSYFLYHGNRFLPETIRGISSHLMHKRS